jgi:excisionase family DNA binding protein
VEIPPQVGRALPLPAPDPLLTPGEVAAMFRVDPKTVSRWSAAGKLEAIKTPGGHRRFRTSQVHAALGLPS